MSIGDLTAPVPAAHTSTSGVRHDLRHELATLQTLFAMAESDPSLEPHEMRRLVATAQSEVGYAMELVDAMASPTATPPAPAEPGPPISNGHVQAALCEMDGVLRAAAKASAASGRTITVDSVAPLQVTLPRTALVRIVRNLLGNALGAAGPGGNVRLHARGAVPVAGEDGGRDAARSHVRLEVHDDGPGPGRAGFHRGGGLGLDVVRSLVLPAGGWLVLGRSPHGGACAAVTLPAAAGM